MADLLEVNNLSVSFDTPQGEVQAVRNVSLSLRSGEVLAIVGESGCGKTARCRSILKLLPKNGRISVIDDAYNSNINGFNGALDTLALFAQTKVLVTPGMVELGDEAYALNFQAGAHAARVCDYIILVGKKQTQPLYDAVVQDGNFPAEHLIVVESLQEAWQRIPALCGGDMIVLLENDLPDNY